MEFLDVMQDILNKIKDLNKKVESIDVILDSSYPPDETVISFGFEECVDFIREDIHINHDIYVKALKEQKEWNLSKIEILKNNLKDLL